MNGTVGEAASKPIQVADDAKRVAVYLSFKIRNLQSAIRDFKQCLFAFTDNQQIGACTQVSIGVV